LLDMLWIVVNMDGLRDGAVLFVSFFLLPFFVISVVGFFKRSAEIHDKGYMIQALLPTPCTQYD
jgi:hypothetical protein